jgi:hypothetical protein
MNASRSIGSLLFINTIIGQWGLGLAKEGSLRLAMDFAMPLRLMMGTVGHTDTRDGPHVGAKQLLVGSQAQNQVLVMPKETTDRMTAW